MPLTYLNTFSIVKTSLQSATEHVAHFSAPIFCTGGFNCKPDIDPDSYCET